MSANSKVNSIIVLDFGSQYTQLIARRIREAGIYCEILPYNVPLETIRQKNPKGLVLSGGPASVYDEGAVHPAPGFFAQVECPILGICYGLQLIAQQFGGEVSPTQKREYGHAALHLEVPDSLLFEDVPADISVWMSHGDHVVGIPSDFRITAKNGITLSAFESLSRCIYAVQFHPEVAHTSYGGQIIQNFLFKICGLKPDWSPHSIIEGQIQLIRSKVGDSSVVCGLSGGVDSAVAAALVSKAIGQRQTCIFVDTGLLRTGEFESTINIYKQIMDLDVRGVKKSQLFLKALANVSDPERKRKIIGKVFIDVFQEEAQRLGNVDYLVQGTLYPDVIESTSVLGPSAIIKSHHNVGGLPKRMKLKLIEPLRDLFKDEVRELGRVLGVPEEILSRHPFPGPGLAVRIIGRIKRVDLELLRLADHIFEEELKSANLYDHVWQAFAVLLPVSTVGVMGDFRSYERVVALRAVTSVDGMTADWAHLPHALLGKISSRIIAEVKGVNRVVYDISSKPPSTIEWE